MSKIKPYKEAAEKLEANHVDEPMLVYGAMVSNAEDYLKDIPQETMQSLVNLAIEDYEMGEMYFSFTNGCLDKRTYGMEVVWSRLTKETLVAIIEDVETNFNSTVVLKGYNKINGHVESLVCLPRIGMEDSYFSSSKIVARYIIHTPNIIYYRIKGNTIIVISVFNTCRSPDTISAVVKDFLEHYKE